MVNSFKKEKISAMILKVAEDYINLGETLEERENYLRSACSAWNIACLSPKAREPAIKQYIEQFQKINNTDTVGCKELEENLRLLIEKKIKMYPYVNIQIANSRLEHINGQDHVFVVSINAGFGASV